MKKEVDIYTQLILEISLNKIKKTYYLKFIVGIIAYFSFVLYFLELSVVYCSIYSIEKV